MNVEILALCDAATDTAGKLNILGAFDTINVGKTPAKHPACAVAVRLRFLQSEVGTFNFRLVLIDADGGNLISPLEGKLTVALNPGFNTASTNIIVNLQGLELKRSGEYRIDFLVGGELKASLPLYVKSIPTGQ